MATARRNSIHSNMMEVAQVVAKRSTCSSKHAVGAVITKSGRVIASGYNGNLPKQDHCDDVGCLPDAEGRCLRSIHAEQNAIYQCAKYGIGTEGATMYTTLAPCLNCAKAIIMAGITTVIYGQHTSSAAIETLLKAGIKLYRYYGPTDFMLEIRSGDDK